MKSSQDSAIILEGMKILKKHGVNTSSARREIVTSLNIQKILENNHQFQEQLDSITGIGNTIIDPLNSMMKEDFQESDTFLHAIIDFFQKEGNIDINIYDIKEELVRSFHSGMRQESRENPDILFSISETKDFINERFVLQNEQNRSNEPVNGYGGNLCYSVTTPLGTKIILSFGDKDTPNRDIQKIQKLFKKTGFLGRIREKLKHIHSRYTDDLTGVYNQRYIQGTVKKNIPYSVIFLDLDRFKEYNDTYGHDMGDILLKEIAKILQTSVRGNDKVCRKGGDEFIIFIDGCDASKEIEKIKERVTEKINHFNLTKQNLDTVDSPLGITIGYAIGDTQSSLEELISQADKNMFENKSNEGGIYRIIEKIGRFSPKEQENILLGAFAMNPELIKTLKKRIQSFESETI